MVIPGVHVVQAANSHESPGQVAPSPSLGCSAEASLWSLHCQVAGPGPAVMAWCGSTFSLYLPPRLSGQAIFCAHLLCCESTCAMVFPLTSSFLWSPARPSPPPPTVGATAAQVWT